MAGPQLDIRLYWKQLVLRKTTTVTGVLCMQWWQVMNYNVSIENIKSLLFTTLYGSLSLQHRKTICYIGVGTSQHE